MSQSLTEIVNQAARPDPQEVLQKIVAAIPFEAGLKDENGNLRSNYPGEKIDFFDRESLLFDAATLADVACYRMTIYGKSVTSYTFMLDNLLAEIEKLDLETANDQFKKIVRAALQQRDHIDGRQTDFEEMLNWQKRRDIVSHYKNGSMQTSLTIVAEKFDVYP